jgi:hypothetical protein
MLLQIHSAKPVGFNLRLRESEIKNTPTLEAAREIILMLCYIAKHVLDGEALTESCRCCFLTAADSAGV